MHDEDACWYHLYTTKESDLDPMKKNPDMKSANDFPFDINGNWKSQFTFTLQR